MSSIKMVDKIKCETSLGSSTPMKDRGEMSKHPVDCPVLSV